jgi:cysteine-rich repeat protein
MSSNQGWLTWVLTFGLAAATACGGSSDGGGNGGGGSDASPQLPDAGEPAVCGDSRTSGDEQCDDGNSNNDDGCTEQCTFSCGDGLLGASEACDTAIAAGSDGACPTTCDDGNGCTQDTLIGTSCQTACTYAIIAEPAEGDGCCPEGASSSTDPDCAVVCGNGIVEAGETCDTAIAGGEAGACPIGCDDGQACTTDALDNAGTCTAACGNAPITAPADDDGCCPAGATIGNDNDCSPGCGDGVVTPPETCDSAIPSGAGACPTACDDGNACTSDRLLSGGTCNASCATMPITTPVNGDGCCPEGADARSDNDCAPECGNRVVEPGEQCDDGNRTAGDGCSASCQRERAAFRLTDLDLRDPHVLVTPIVGCTDATDMPVFGIFAVNDELRKSISTDEDGDGFYGLGIVIDFQPLAPGLPSTGVDVIISNCSTSNVCTPQNPDEIVMSTATNQSAGVCLQPLAGTIRPYTPAIQSPAGPCFASGAASLTVSIAGIPITLTDARIAATYSGSPATNLVNGVIRGFISEAVAAATRLPDDLPLLGGAPLASVLPGGAGNCARYSDKDTGPGGVQGWYFYLNFTAERTTLMR